MDKGKNKARNLLTNRFNMLNLLVIAQKENHEGICNLGAAVRGKGRFYRWKDRRYQFWLRIPPMCSAMYPAYSAGEDTI